MRRLRTHLEKMGVVVKILVTQPPPENMGADAETFDPDLIHAFHAFKAGVFAEGIAQSLGCPLVVTLTGTDIHHDIYDPDRGEKVRRVIERACAVATFAPEIAEEARQALTGADGKVRVIPQGAWLPPQRRWDVRKALGIPETLPLLLLPANIRRVKRPTLAIEGVRRLRERGINAHLLLVGSITEEEEWERVRPFIKGNPWVHYWGAVPLEEMASVYEAADIVLNTSESEGGMANALLEAMLLQRPVLAAAVPGNISLVRPGKTGLLFCDPDELAERAEQLLTDLSLRERLTRQAFEWVQTYCLPEEEAQRYLAIYRSCVGGKGQ